MRVGLDLRGYVVAQYPAADGAQWYLIVPPRDEAGAIVRDGCPPGLIDIVEGPVQIAMYLLGATKKQVRARQRRLVRAGHAYFRQVNAARGKATHRSLIESNWLYMPPATLHTLKRMPGDVVIEAGEMKQLPTQF